MMCEWCKSEPCICDQPDKFPPIDILDRATYHSDVQLRLHDEYIELAKMGIANGFALELVGVPRLVGPHPTCPGCLSDSTDFYQAFPDYRGIVRVVQCMVCHTCGMLFDYE